MNQSDLLYSIALTRVKGIGSVLAKNLIAYCGSAEMVFKTKQAQLVKIPLVGEERAAFITAANVMKEAEPELAFIQKHKISALLFTDEAYPYRLKECADSPIVLYYKGNADLNAKKIVAVVGTRKMSDYGKELTKKFVSDLAALDVLVVSGLAYGVDACAHQAALDSNMKTIGVLGHGLNRIYPEQNKKLAKQMIEQGGLLTGFTSQDVFSPHNFPTRNRIVAGMSDAVVVVETQTDGGAVLTALNAFDYNRDVFTFPGRISDKLSAGCNKLIKSNQAALIESADDFLKAMSWDVTENKQKKRRPVAFQLSAEEQQVVTAIERQSDSVQFDWLLLETKQEIGALSALLLNMEMNNIVVSLPGKIYKLAN